MKLNFEVPATGADWRNAMQAIILAAGMGKRLKEYTAENTKCMVKVNGTTLIERALRILDKKQLSRIVIVVGYEGRKLMDYIGTLAIQTPICFINNEVYDKTNNIYSLALAKQYLVSEDTLLFESDIIFEEALVDILMEDSRETLALVDKFASWMDGTCMVLDDDDSIKDFIPGKYLKFEDKGGYYKTVNIYKFSQHFSANTYVPFLEAYAKAMGNNEYYESVIKLIALLETKEIKAKRLNGEVWYEIDDIQDLDIAESLFAGTIQKRYDAIASRYGGHWRYPKLLDFCYLVNPYFPPQKMLDEMKSNFEILISEYPSGMRINSLLASRNFGVRPEHIVIGNGAAELIKVLMEHTEGPVGFIRPTFEEYPNRYDSALSVVYTPDNEDFSYTAEDLIRYYGSPGHTVGTLVLINPDNPSGNYIDCEGLKKLIDWARTSSIRLVIDESFSDFAELSGDTQALDLSLINEEVLQSYSGLFVVKSISKSYGVPGIRLGVLASSDEAAIALLKKEAPIWNINSFGEFFMQISEKYKKDYRESLKKLAADRSGLIKELSSVSFLRPIPSQANYVMCEVMEGRTSREIACELLKHDIFIKDLTSKLHNGRQYVRIAVRNGEDNLRLITALKAMADGAEAL